MSGRKTKEYDDFERPDSKRFKVEPESSSSSADEEIIDAQRDLGNAERRSRLADQRSNTAPAERDFLEWKQHIFNRITEDFLRPTIGNLKEAFVRQANWSADIEAVQHVLKETLEIVAAISVELNKNRESRLQSLEAIGSQTSMALCSMMTSLNAETQNIEEVKSQVSAIARELHSVVPCPGNSTPVAGPSNRSLGGRRVFNRNEKH